MSYQILTSGPEIQIAYDTPLTPNRVYEVTISAGVSGVFESGVYTLAQDYTFWFTSAYCPLFTTLTRVKLDAGPYSDWFTDDTIYRMIHKNSIDAIDIFNAYHNATVPYDAYGCTYHNVPAVLKRYVECKTAYDIIALIQLSLTGAGIGNGGQLKTLGDMTISYTSRLLHITDLLKELYDCWMTMLNAIKVRGIDPAVPGLFDTSKMFLHPALDVNHNRIVRTVDVINANPVGPWRRSANWRPNVPGPWYNYNGWGRFRGYYYQ